MDVEKTMAFILEQNAATSAQLQQVTADLEVHTEWKIQLSQAMQDLAMQMKQGFTLVDQKLVQLADKHRELAEQHGHLAVKHEELAELQKITQENLNILIRTVQDMIPRLPRE